MSPASSATCKRGGSTLAAAGVAALVAATLGCGGSSAPRGGSSPPPDSGPRPSFVVIVADDMAYRLFGADRRFAFLDLPNLERLAAQGVQFDSVFVTTSLCSPSRATILSGLYAHAHGVTVNDKMDLPPSVTTFPELMQQAGYRTAFIGKWHMDSTTDAPRPGFDYWVSFRGQGVYQDPLLNDNGVHAQRTGYITDLLTDYAVDWLHERGSEPFLLILSHKAPHGPFLPAPRHANALADAAMPEPTNFRDSFFDKPAWERRYAKCGGTAAAFTECSDPLPPELAPWPWSGRVPWRIDYLRTLLALDDSVGRVRSALTDQGLASSTYVVFLSDNGMMLGEHRFGDKRVAYEESMRIPLVIGGADLKPGRVGGIVLNLDLAPTLLALARIPVPPQMQGRSLVGLLSAGFQSVRDSFLYEYFNEALIPVVPRMVGVRTKGLKYVTYPGSPEEELYDLDGDPAELTDLADRPDWAATRADLRRQLDRLLLETGGQGVGGTGP